MSHRVPADVAWVGVGDPAAGAVYLMKVPDGRPVVLEGSAAAIWTLAVSGADPVSGIADLTGEAEEVVFPHVGLPGRPYRSRPAAGAAPRPR